MERVRGALYEKYADIVAVNERAAEDTIDEIIKNLQ